MIIHYLTTALANFRKTPFTTAANVLTLALGLACFIAAFGIATYWRSADNYHELADRTYVIGQTVSNVDDAGGGTETTGTSAAVGRYLGEDFPEFEMVVRSYGASGLPVIAGENRALLNGSFVETGFLDYFDLDFIEGDDRALDAPGSVILTEETARRLFPDGGAVGSTLSLPEGRSATVTGVFGPVRQPSFIGNGPNSRNSPDMIGNWYVLPGGVGRDEDNLWASTSTLTVVVLREGASVDAVSSRLVDFIERRMPEEQRQSAHVALSIFPFSEITTRSINTSLFGGSDLGLSTIGVLLGFGLLTLMIAALNYANLATAQATTRSAEVGMRKVLGANRVQIMAQAWLEALVQTLAAALLALVLLALARPVLLTAWDVDVIYFLADPFKAVAVVGGIVAVVSLLAGAYPALVTAGLRPASAVRSGRSRSGSKAMARVLVSVQFLAASFLLIMLTVATQQRAYFERMALDNGEDPIVVLGDIMEAGISYDAFDNALSNSPGIVDVTVSDRVPWGGGATTFFVSRTLEPGATELNVLTKHIGYDYFPTLDLEVLAGRVFDRTRDTQPMTVTGSDPSTPILAVIDELLAENLGFTSPQAAVGEVVYLPPSFMRFVGRETAQPVQIIGVVETDRMRVEARNTSGYFYFFGPNSPAQGVLFPSVRIDRSNLQAGMASIERIWAEMAPDSVLQTAFIEEIFEGAYREYERVSQLFIFLASTAFIIATVGLLGIAVQVASRRRHEIAVRKTLGASVTGIVRLLLTDFSIPVLIGNLLAWPLGYVAAQTYLSAFAHRFDLGIAPFAFSLGLTLVIAWIAVVGVVAKAASVHPAEVLRHA